MNYQYMTKLGEHELRLLCPVKVTHYRLAFRIITVRRLSAPEYTALSYAWGTQNTTERISIDGYPFPVTPNLWSCLFNLAGTVPSLNLWVDAICINQEDNQEKSSQVKRMHDTYATADHVAVWLGLPSIWEPGRTWLPDPITQKTFQVEDFDWWENMEDMARRDYWGRFWVIQEMLLGRDILIWCGNHATSLDQFQEILCRLADISQYSSSSRDWKSNRYPALPLIMGRHVDRYPEMRESLGTLLIRHRRSECKDPRDRVFALIGIVEHEEASLLSRFLPDYSLSEREVAVIALAHVNELRTIAVSPETRNIDMHSEEIFEALRIRGKKQRRELLEIAKGIDYIGSESVEEIRSQLLYYEPSSLPGPTTALSDEEFLAIADELLFHRRQKSKCIML